MRLFIAEKPDLAKAIVEGLGGGSRKDGYYDCGGDYVAWKAICRNTPTPC